MGIQKLSAKINKALDWWIGWVVTSELVVTAFSYPEPILRAVNGARQGALAKSISNWHLIGHNEGCCSNTGYILLPCFYGIRLWIWPEPLVAPRVRRALGTRMVVTGQFWGYIWGWISISFPGYSLFPCWSKIPWNGVMTFYPDFG